MTTRQREKVKIKQCTRCGQLKTLYLFYNDMRMPDGKNNACKFCVQNDRRLRAKGIPLPPSVAKRTTHPKGARVRNDSCWLSDGTKICSSCKLAKPESEYSGGFTTKRAWCKSCTTLKKRCAQFGVTPEQLDYFIRSQNGCCAICGKRISGKGAHLDHDHETNIIRGLLCFRCNAALGLFDDNIHKLRNAAKYLRRFSQKVGV